MINNFFKQTQPHVIRAMESGDHSKNGASPKSQMSRKNFLNLFLISCLLTVSMCFMTGCGKDGPDNPDNAVPDPEGTISYTLTKTSLYDEGNVLELGTGSIILTPASNLKVSNALICTVGKVNGLGNVTKIPSGNSWTTEIGAVLNQGYIVKLSDDSYMRLFIFDWDEEYNISASGVTYTRFYCKIKYQYPFEP